jgi:hypothetical protein
MQLDAFVFKMLILAIPGFLSYTIYPRLEVRQLRLSQPKIAVFKKINCALLSNGFFFSQSVLTGAELRGRLSWLFPDWTPAVCLPAFQSITRRRRSAGFPAICL